MSEFIESLCLEVDLTKTPIFLLNKRAASFSFSYQLNLTSSKCSPLSILVQDGQCFDYASVSIFLVDVEEEDEEEEPRSLADASEMIYPIPQMA